jgi:hypothetical protein
VALRVTYAAYAVGVVVVSAVLGVATGHAAPAFICFGIAAASMTLTVSAMMRRSDLLPRGEAMSRREVRGHLTFVAVLARWD